MRLIVHPRDEVERGTNVTLECQAEVSHKEGSQPNHNYSFYKDFKSLNTDQTSSRDNFYSIPDARMAHSGKYQCVVNTKGQKEQSSVKALTVKGRGTHQFNVQKNCSQKSNIC